MDVYHRVLTKLFEATGGSDSKAVDLADLVKKLGFHANYKNIFKELSVQGWLVETSKVDWVKITHWGIIEAKKSVDGEGTGGDELKKGCNRLLSEARELIGLLDILTDEISKDNFSKVEKKVSQINKMTDELKSKF